MTLSRTILPTGLKLHFNNKDKESGSKRGERGISAFSPVWWWLYTHSIACACMTPNHQSLIYCSGRNPSGHLIAWLALAATMSHQIAQCNVLPFLSQLLTWYLITGPREAGPFFMSVCLCAQRFLFDVTASIDFRWPLADIKTRSVRKTDLTMICIWYVYLLTNLTTISLSTLLGSFWSWCMS